MEVSRTDVPGLFIPNGPDAAPLVTVRLTALNFQPLTTMIFGTSVPMPDFRAALKLEDGSGTVAN